MIEEKHQEKRFLLKNILIPFTTRKAILLIIIAGAIVYSNALFGKFVWDDLPFIIFNPDTRSLNIPHLFGFNIFNSSGYYRPIPAVYFTILFKLFGMHYFYYHFLQISLHMLNACLVFLFFKKFFKGIFSLFLALLFLVHPIQVESVAFIGASQSELFFLFGISALLISMRDKLHIGHMLLVSMFLLLSMLTKETGFLFVLIVLAFQFLFKRKRLLTFLPYISIILAIYFYLRLIFAGVYFEKIEFVPIAQLPLIKRLITIPEIIFYYIKTLFYPARLAIEQHWVVQTINFQKFYFPLLIDLLFFMLLILAGFYIFRKSKKSFGVFIFFFIWFTAGLGMLLQIFPLDMTVADRWFYFPLVGLLGCLGVVLNEIPFRKKSLQIVCILFIVVIVILSVRTMVRNQNWNNPIALYSHDVPIEGNFDNENNYAAALSYEGRWEEALNHVKKSVELYPYEKNLRELGLVYKKLGRNDLAREYFYKALNAKSFVYPPHKHEVHTYEYIIKYEYLYGDTKEAVRIARMGTSDYPENAELWMLLAISEYKLNNQENALKAAEKAFSLQQNAKTAYLYRQIMNNLPLTVTTSF
jgi:protein O-mannosyl-transferase